MAAEYADLPDTVKTEVQTFADVNVAWLTKMLAAASVSARYRSLYFPGSPQHHLRYRIRCDDIDGEGACSRYMRRRLEA